MSCKALRTTFAGRNGGGGCCDGGKGDSSTTDAWGTQIYEVTVGVAQMLSKANGFRLVDNDRN